MPGKLRGLASLGLLGQSSSWGLAGGIADFSDVVLGAAGAVATSILALPPDTNLGVIGLNDPYPSPIAAATGSRAAGASSAPAAVLTRAWIFDANTAGTGLYAPANVTIGLSVISGSNTGTAAGVVSPIVTAVTLSTFNTQLWNPLTFIAPTGDRIASLTGTAPASNPWMLYFSDMVIATLTASAAFTSQATQKLAVVLEWA